MSPWIAATPLGLVAHWSTRSQQQARRNASAACTALAARRLERLEVEAFVAEHRARHQARLQARPQTRPHERQQARQEDRRTVAAEARAAVG